ncbi:uncharacterized protein (TIGR02448 family) [Pseudomonas duriflava]|uniref:Uncharacterized protein (TIGR02448 family) n=1 Tax=Pseudomonas duriflava TaxID=459528 RepID=A0A562QIP4_9PSED|nr:DUF2388 domain-containing protein [Pseudomonas duriflava]TWI56638.1 uncharacterized protein (TIGR02448 family) [Pseudomonas duriflava]
MPLRYFVILGTLLATPAFAIDVTTEFVARSLYVTSKVTSAPFDNKLVQAARDDAALFIASNGAQRSATLESALRVLRSQNPHLVASDQELAEAILAQ